MKKLLVFGLFVLLFVGAAYFSNALGDVLALAESDFARPELISPFDRIRLDQIVVYDDRVVLDVADIHLVRIADTNSMDPFIDAGATVLLKDPVVDEVYIGDVVTYRDGDSLIIHRVVAIFTDEDGVYYLLKGDNNEIVDSRQVRFSDITGVLVGVVY